MTFKSGESGNAAGRPKGARNRVTRAVEQLFDGEAENLTRKVIELGLGGDPQALRLCLSMIAPPRRDRPVSIALPEIKSPADAITAMAAITNAVAASELTPAEGAEVGKLIESYSKIIETHELAERVNKLEKRNAS